MTRTFLVADRDQATRQFVGAILNDKGLNAVHASDAERARTVLEDNPAITGVIADVSLCTAGSTRLVAELRHDPRYDELPIIGVGSGATVGQVLAALEQGASRYVPKCALANALAEEIDAVMLE